MAKPKFTLVDHLMNEIAIYGGLPMRRGDICKLAREHMGERAKEPPLRPTKCREETLMNVDNANLKMLQAALRQHDSFGVNTDPTSPLDKDLYESMVRLEASGHVRRAFETDSGIWWQAVDAGVAS